MMTHLLESLGGVVALMMHILERLEASFAFDIGPGHVNVYLNWTRGEVGPLGIAATMLSCLCQKGFRPFLEGALLNLVEEEVGVFVAAVTVVVADWLELLFLVWCRGRPGESGEGDENGYG